jgi:hypothetical protein
VGDEIWDNEEYVPNTVVDGWGGTDGEFYAINYNFISGASVHRIGDRSIPTSVEDYNTLVNNFSLISNYPNPFNPSTTIEFYNPVSDAISLEIYDILGNKVATLINNQELTPGLKRLVWNGRDDHNNQMVSGVYIYRITSGKLTAAKKMMLLK